MAALTLPLWSEAKNYTKTNLQNSGSVPNRCKCYSCTTKDLKTSPLGGFIYLCISSGCSAVRLAHSLRVREVGGSNPPIPTLFVSPLSPKVTVKKCPKPGSVFRVLDIKFFTVLLLLIAIYSEYIRIYLIMISRESYQKKIEKSLQIFPACASGS